MKAIVLTLIRTYQSFTRSGISTPFFFGSFSGCRSWPTCSDYAHTAITQHGVVTGGARALKRILHCHSFSKTSLQHQ